MFHYVSKLGNGQDIYEDSQSSLDTRKIAENAVLNSKITTNRFNPITISVEVSELTIKLGAVEKRVLTKVNITPPYAPLTQNDYISILEKELESIPKEFHDCVAKTAWADNGSYEESLSNVRKIIGYLIPAIADFRKYLFTLE